jgi:hypothetical protein
VEIVSLTSFLVHPGKNTDSPPESQGTTVPLHGNLYTMLSRLFSRAETECDIPITFTADEDGSQNNPARNVLMEFLRDPGVSKGGALANRLRDVTTNVPGLGLLFLILGRDNNQQIWKVALCRFPADIGILAEADQHGLRLQLLERVFMKKATAYKAAVYRGQSLEAGFWRGHAVDKQLNAPNRQIADYWVREFLASDLLTTSKSGSKRFARALAGAGKNATSVDVQRELTSLRVLARGLRGQSISIQTVMDRFALSEAARRAIIAALPHEGILTDPFVLDDEEFVRYAPFTRVELHTGAVLQGPSDSFADVFARNTIDEDTKLYRYTTEGRLVDERVKGAK